ncbi:hypothetical protein BGZ83_005382 [Gryganskiella cystojenkinii]|nr:hypothetical protein BGZ83_005382 [Gryganskiella cystojenkinii]
MAIVMPPSPAASISSSLCGRGYHSRNSSESSLLFTPPLSPTEEQLLAFLIPDIEPSELAAYLSAPTTPILSDVSCLIGKSTKNSRSPSSFHSTMLEVETVYPSPVCAAAAATVVALDRLDSQSVETACDVYALPALGRNKRCSTYAFMEADHDLQTKEIDEEIIPESDFSSPVYVMSSRNTRKRLMLEQPFVHPDDDDEESQQQQNCYAQLFHGASSSDDDNDSLTQDLSETLAFDLILV